MFKWKAVLKSAVRAGQRYTPVCSLGRRFMERWEVLLCVWTERAQLFSSGCMSIHLWELEGGLSGKTLVR